MYPTRSSKQYCVRWCTYKSSGMPGSSQKNINLLGLSFVYDN